MLEVRHLKKTYTPKKGVPVVALNDISIKFPDKGLIFILGKSGSGKSTLLNVMGGLDKADEGEIIIKDKSSADFKQSDFDSYRNTYLGFIFQEYNILEDFSIAANIGLALELQGQKATNERINQILQQVGLDGYGKRKPNELSGGQKQRVAIARALVKNPEIIMADEPTGALDSNTGIQVFDTLKELSKEKLVIVVSHDRDFAEQYGDRVIEFKDGIIISDIEKTRSEALSSPNGEVKVFDNKLLKFRKGYKLTSRDVEMINACLANNDAMVSLDEDTNVQVRKFARIDENDNIESFKATDESAIVNSDKTPFKLIKSRLPYKNSLKMGASSLRSKPVRLIFTILLCFVAFAMFGFVDSLAAYNKIDVTVNSMKDQNINYVSISKEIGRKYDSEDDYISYNESKMSDEDIQFLNDKIGGTFKPIYAPMSDNGYSSGLSLSASLAKEEYNEIYTRQLSGYCELTQADISAMGFTVIGRLPENYDEVLLPSYVFDHFKQFGYKDGSSTMSSTEVQAMSMQNFLAGVAKHITLGEQTFTISGFVDTRLNLSAFSGIGSSSGIDNYMKIEQLRNEVGYGVNAVAIVKEGFIAKAKSKGGAIGAKVYNGAEGINLKTTNDTWPYSLQYYIKASMIDAGDIKYFDSSKTSLNSGEMLISASRLKEMFNWIYESSTAKENIDTARADKFESLIENSFDNLSYDNRVKVLVRSGATEEEAKTMLDNIATEKSNIVQRYANVLSDNLTENEFDPDNTLYGMKITALKDAMVNNWNDVLSLLEHANVAPNFDLTADYNSISSGYKNGVSIKVVGIFFENTQMAAKNSNDEELSNGYYLLNDELFDEVVQDANAIYTGAIAVGTESVIKNAVDINYKGGTKNSNGTYKHFKLNNKVTAALSSVNGIFESLSKIFLYVGLGLLVFASLMFMNYIGTSISYKKREIGILRAVGATSGDVFGIFLNEAMIISIINFVLAAVGSGVAVFITNRALVNEYSLPISLLTFGIRQIAIMLAVCVAVAFISSLIPVLKIAKKRPIDAIRNR